MNYKWCRGCVNYLGSLGCALENEEVFEGGDYTALNYPYRQDTSEENVSSSSAEEA